MHLTISLPTNPSTPRSIHFLHPKHGSLPHPHAQSLWNTHRTHPAPTSRDPTTYLPLLPTDTSKSLSPHTLTVNDLEDNCTYVFQDHNSILQWAIELHRDADNVFQTPDTYGLRPYSHEFFKSFLIPVKTDMIRYLEALAVGLLDMASLYEVNTVCYSVKVYLNGTHEGPVFTMHHVFGNTRLDRFFELLCGEEEVEDDWTVRMVVRGGFSPRGVVYDYGMARKKGLLVKELGWEPLASAFVYLMVEPGEVVQL